MPCLPPAHESRLDCSREGAASALALGLLLVERLFMTSRRNNSADTEIFERQANICKAFAHATRLRLLDLLGQRERGVSELQAELGVSKTNLSQHLAILRAAGVLSTRRDGKQVYCSLAIPEVKQACQLIRKVLQAQLVESRRLAR